MTVSTREALAAFAMVAHPRLGASSAASRLPDVALRRIALFVGVLPTVREAVSMTRGELRTIISRTTKRHVPARVGSTTLILRFLCPLVWPELSPSDHKAHYDAALKERASTTRRALLQKQRATTIRKQLALCRTDVARTADLLRQLHGCRPDKEWS